MDVGAAARRQRVGAVIAELGLSDRAEVRILSLSGGQRKRVSIALELLTEPKLLFLDEPTSGLDPGMEKHIMDLLRGVADRGRSVVVVTHSVQSLDRCDRVLFLAPGGRTAFYGPPSETQSYFHLPTLPDVFSALEGQRGRDWAGEYLLSSACARYAYGPPPREPAATWSPLLGTMAPNEWRTQFRTLVKRYLSIIAADRRGLAFLLAQAPAIGLLMLIVVGANAFSPLATPDTAQAASTLIFFLVLGAALLGGLNSIREIVKERAIYQRERAVGLTIRAYLGSKLVVLGGLTFIQAVALVLLATARADAPAGGAALGSGTLELIVAVTLAGLGVMSLGLMISALVRSSDKAMTLLPLLIIPLLVLAQPTLKLEDIPVMQEASYLAPTQWGYAAMASTVDLNTINQSAQPPGAPAITPAQGRWSHTPWLWLGDTTMLVILLVLGVAGTYRVLLIQDRRHTPR